MKYLKEAKKGNNYYLFMHNIKYCKNQIIFQIKLKKTFDKNVFLFRLQKKF